MHGYGTYSVHYRVHNSQTFDSLLSYYFLPNTKANYSDVDANLFCKISEYGKPVCVCVCVRAFLPRM